MKKNLIIACAILTLLMIFFGGVRVIRVVLFLNAQEKKIKQALRTAEAGILLSNATGGADRFVNTGELVLEPSYLLHPEKMKQRNMFNMRLKPRVCTGRNDGWVGIYQGHWYVKIY